MTQEALPLIECPEPGIYPGMPMAVYHQWDAVSNSRLSLLKRSPAHLKAHLEIGSAETEALRFGSAAHMCVLEPELFAVRYAKKGRCTGITGNDTQCRNQASVLKSDGRQVCKTHLKSVDEIDDTVELMTEAKWDACIAIREVIRSKRKASGLLTPDGRSELSIVWVDPATGLTCKARVDHYEQDIGGGTFIDLKTTRDARSGPFERSVFNYGYHRQGAFYKRGLEAHGLPAANAVILPVEKKPPYECGVYRMLEGALDAGEEEVRVLMELYAECYEANDWPGYPDEVRDITLPDWAWRKVDEEMAERDDDWI